jgi:hypothetical protein
MIKGKVILNLKKNTTSTYKKKEKISNREQDLYIWLIILNYNHPIIYTIHRLHLQIFIFPWVWKLFLQMYVFFNFP